MTVDEGDSAIELASPPCLRGELDPHYFGGPEPDARPPAMDVEAIMRWRLAERGRLVAARLAIRGAERAAVTRRLRAALERELGDPAGRIIGGYWPFRGEPDLRPWLRSIRERGGRVALPVVLEPDQPMPYREWWPAARMARGFWGIRYPEEGGQLSPEVVVVPLLGFDVIGHRLGHGTGFFDRTLAAMRPKPLIIGVGFAHSRLETIHPLPHDVPMDRIVTEAGVMRLDGR